MNVFTSYPHSPYKSKKISGFTIVELLIVIVVIAILAAISIVAYNGIQERARNDQVIQGVNTYYKAFLSYYAVHSQYPLPSAPDRACLGENYPDNICWQGESGTLSVRSAVDAQLAEFISAKPTLATQRFSIGIGNNMRAGAIYDPNNKKKNRLLSAGRW
ncbi:MAG: type II secretion system protein [Candidatus Saccharimonas sp.]